MKKAKQSLKIIITTQLFLALSILIGRAQTPQSVDSLLLCIDEAIDHSAQYVSRKEQRIRQLQQQLSQAKNLHAQYQLSYRLYEEYTPFVNDSAIIYLKRCIEIARKTGKHSEVGKCQALIAIRCSSTGKFIEALNTLNAIDTTQFDNIASRTQTSHPKIHWNPTPDEIDCPPTNPTSRTIADHNKASP